MFYVSSRIWTRVAVSISYDDNHYTTGTTEFLLIETQNNTIITNDIKAKIYNP